MDAEIRQALVQSMETEWEQLSAQEQRIWIKVRCWHELTKAECEFLLEVDAVRGYAVVPIWLEISGRVGRVIEDAE